MNRIVARVMSGAVMKEEGRLQAAAAARILSRHDYIGEDSPRGISEFQMSCIIKDDGVIFAAGIGDVDGVLCYLLADANCASECTGE